MSDTTTQPKPEIVNDLLQLVEDSLKQAKQAYTELALEREDKVRLEKVASEAKQIDTDLVDRTVALLVRNDYLDETQQEKFASDLASHPENALKLVNRLIEISAPAYSEGRGVPKQASTEKILDNEADDSAWFKVLDEGA